jgi:hypothetical protein
MNYVLMTLKAEIKVVKRYVEYCKERAATFGIDPQTEAKFKKEVRTNVKRLQDFREAINLLKEYKRTPKQ